jgi:hypothetical protein
MAENETDAREGGVATEEANARLEHPAGGTTTRDDALDAGVPMLQGDQSEPVGPEDALGDGPKRGDYSERVVGVSYESRPVAGGGRPVTRWVDGETGKEAKEGAKGAIEVAVDLAPVSELVAQTPRAFDVGEVAGKKGGVQTAGETA